MQCTILLEKILTHLTKSSSQRYSNNSTSHSKNPENECNTIRKLYLLIKYLHFYTTFPIFKIKNNKFLTQDTIFTEGFFVINKKFTDLFHENPVNWLNSTLFAQRMNVGLLQVPTKIEFQQQKSLLYNQLWHK